MSNYLTDSPTTGSPDLLTAVALFLAKVVYDVTALAGGIVLAAWLVEGLGTLT